MFRKIDNKDGGLAKVMTITITVKVSDTKDAFLMIDRAAQLIAEECLHGMITDDGGDSVHWHTQHTPIEKEKGGGCTLMN